MKKFKAILVLAIVIIAVFLGGCGKDMKEEAKDVATKAFDALKNKDYEKYYSYFSKDSMALIEETPEKLAERLKNEQGAGGIDIQKINMFDIQDNGDGIMLLPYETVFVDKAKKEKIVEGEIALRKEKGGFKILYEGMIKAQEYEESKDTLQSGQYRISVFKSVDAVNGKHIYTHIENNSQKLIDFGGGGRDSAKITLTTDEGVYTAELKAKYKPQDDTVVDIFFKDAKGEVLKVEAEGVYFSNDPSSIVIYEKKNK